MIHINSCSNFYCYVESYCILFHLSTQIRKKIWCIIEIIISLFFLNIIPLVHSLVFCPDLKDILATDDIARKKEFVSLVSCNLHGVIRYKVQKCGFKIVYKTFRYIIEFDSAQVIILIEKTYILDKMNQQSIEFSNWNLIQLGNYLLEIRYTIWIKLLGNYLLDSIRYTIWVNFFESNLDKTITNKFYNNQFTKQQSNAI